jgi:hypothetical protein
MTYGISSTFRLRAALISHTLCFVIENWGCRKAAPFFVPISPRCGLALHFPGLARKQDGARRLMLAPA